MVIAWPSCRNYGVVPGDLLYKCRFVAPTASQAGYFIRAHLLTYCGGVSSLPCISFLVSFHLVLQVLERFTHLSEMEVNL